MTESQLAADASAGVLRLPKWWTLVLIGFAGIIAGVLAIVWPDVTMLVLGLIFGIFLLVWGVTTLISVFQPGESFASTVLGVVVGLLSTIAGLVCIVRPQLSIVALLFIVAFWFMVVGISDVVRGVVDPAYRWWNLIFGAVMLIAGIIIVSNPDIAITTLALIVGISFIVRGVLDIALGALIRGAEKAEAEAAL